MKVVKAVWSSRGTQRRTLLQTLAVFSGDVLKLTHQHLGGVLPHLPNGRKDTFVTLLSSKDEIKGASSMTVVKIHVLFSCEKCLTVVTCSRKISDVHY